MKIAVTGGSGSIGNHVCNALLGAGLDVVSVDQVPPSADVRFVKVDLCNLKATCEALEGFDQVVHLAAIPNPFTDPAEKVIGVNMMTSFNVFEAARKNSIIRVIYGCSESSTGFGIHKLPVKPLYVPIDEKHPCWPHETYSFSKHFGERIGANYAQVYGLEVISLRYTWVWAKNVEKEAAKIVADARAGTFKKEDAWFGAYIMVEDVARACLAASTFKFSPDSPRFEAFFLTAKNTFYPIPTLNILRTIYGKLPRVKDKGYFEDNSHASVFDIRKAERMLGWKPRCDWHDFEKWEL